MFKRIMILDAETRWSRRAADWCPDTYTLSGMTTEEYVRSDLFKAFGFGYKYFGEEGAAVWVRYQQLDEFFDSIDWSTTAVCCHNAMFDVAILTWIYGKVPAFIFDTLSMARALRGLEVGNSAAKLADAFGLPPKGKAVYSTDGLWELPFEVEMELAEYCRHDVFLCEEFLKRLLPDFKMSELKLIDMTVRMFTEPQLELDGELLGTAIAEEKVLRESLLARVGVAEDSLASADKFAQALIAVGVPPPMKTSNATGLPIYAFAKSDALFQAIQNGDNEDAVLLCEARLKVKSTQERTRAQRFLDISTRGMFPVPVSYAHTRTLRWGASKGSSINVQNLKRNGMLRKAILAPAGSQCVVGDLSQIEPRVLAWLAGYQDMLDIFASKQDAYAMFGRQMFNDPTITKDSAPLLRQSAKSGMLGAGYGLGWASFATQLLTGFLGAPPMRYDKAFSKQLGIGRTEAEAFAQGKAGAARMARMEEIPHTCTDDELFMHCVCAKEIIDRYRSTAAPVVEFWRFLDKMIATVIADPQSTPVVFKCLAFSFGQILLPNGLPIRYDSVECVADEFGRPQYSYWNGKMRRPLHSGVVAENVTSGTARCVIGDGMLRVAKRYRTAMPVHDELVVVVKDEDVQDAKAWIHAQITAEPAYMPGIPLDAEVGANRRYGLAK